jgi:uncharacterized membrane protein YeaQ/YmgE (transglycosylase-associated protein family)
MTFQLLVMWILAGLLAGGMAGLVLKRGGYGWGADIALGLSGALLGSWVFRMLSISPEAGLFAVVVVAFVGATGVIVAQRKLWPTIA